MGLKKVLKYVVVLCCTICFSQEEDSTRIAKFQSKISTRLSYTHSFNTFDFITDGQTVFLEPDTKSYIGGSILFRSIDLNFGFSPKFLSENETSKLLSLNFKMYFGQWIQTIDFYQQQGLETTIGDETLYSESIKTLKVGGSSLYVWNKNFSYRALSYQNEMQTKSTGSFIPGITYYYTYYNFNSKVEDAKSYNFNVVLSPAYHYNIVLKENILLALGGTLGIGFNHAENFDSRNSNSLSYLAKMNISLGYNSSSFFGGINTSFASLRSKIGADTILNDNISFGELYIGYRFNAPKSLMKLADQFNKKFNL